MDKLEQLKELLKNLSPEEMEELRVFLSRDEEVDENFELKEDKVSDSADEQSSESEEVDNDSDIEENSEEPISTEETQEETEPETEEPAEEVKDEVSTEEEVVKQEEQAENIEDEDIPKMQKGIQTVNEESEVPNITTDEGEELPVDYEKIIEGLNAKNAALEAENKALKAKVDGAFGYSAKPSTPAKVNRLYDDAADDIHFHK